MANQPRSRKKPSNAHNQSEPDRGGIEKDQFFQCYGLTEEILQKTGLEWATLEEIHDQHVSVMTELRSAADYVSGRLQQVPAVHSLKIRVKNPEHLVEKVIRKKLKSPELSFDEVSYETLITDLIGIRALHLIKDEWRAIHEFVTDTWELFEQPLAYVRQGDPPALLQGFGDAGCRVDEHPFGYRSIHYILKTQPAKCVRLVELQVRTIFEEGWSEIDHRVRYPRQSDNPYLAGFLTIFNRLAGAADEMGTFTKELSSYIHAQGQREEETEQLLREKEEALKKAVSQLQISKEEKSKLEKQIAGLTRPPKQEFVGSNKTITFSELLGPDNLILRSTVLDFPGMRKLCTACRTIYTDTSAAGLEFGYQTVCPTCRQKSAK